MCFNLPCVGQTVSLLDTKVTSAGIIIPAGTKGVVGQEDLEKQEIIVTFQFPDETLVTTRVSGNEAERVEDEDLEFGQIPRFIYAGQEVEGQQFVYPVEESSVFLQWIQSYLKLPQVEHTGPVGFTNAIASFAEWMNTIIPQQPALLLNYPNPFNRETWIPYQLAVPAKVLVSIYTPDGGLVRTLDLGYQHAGMYQSKSRAAYWDSRNDLGERMPSGVYLCTFTADDFQDTREMLIRE